MPVFDLMGRQRSLVRIGNIRLGEKRVTRNGKQFPASLDRFRLTSRAKSTIDSVADVYGGEVSAWDDAPGGPQWQVTVEAEELQVIIPIMPSDEPGNLYAIDQALEFWSGGGRIRRCNGQICEMNDQSGAQVQVECMCRALGLKEEQCCKPVTRLNVMLPQVAGLGVWHLESRGVYAFLELPGLVEYMRSMSGNGVYLPGALSLEQRQAIADGKTKNFVVPVIRTNIRPQDVIQVAGLPAPTALTAHADPPEMTAIAAEPTPAQPAIEAAPEPAPVQFEAPPPPPAPPSLSGPEPVADDDRDPFADEQGKLLDVPSDRVPAPGLGEAEAAGVRAQREQREAAARGNGKSVWDGPGQCPGCHAPPGKPHGVRCAAIAA